MKTYDRVWLFFALLVVFMCVMLIAPVWAKESPDPKTGAVSQTVLSSGFSRAS